MGYLGIFATTCCRRINFDLDALLASSRMELTPHFPDKQDDNGPPLGFKDLLGAVNPNGPWFGGVCMASVQNHDTGQAMAEWSAVLARVTTIVSSLITTRTFRRKTGKRTVKCHRDAPSLLADTYIHTCCCTSCEHDPSQLNEARASLNYWVDQEGGP